MARTRATEERTPEATEKVAEFVELAAPEDRRGAVCDRVALHYGRGRAVCVYDPDAERAAELDDMLWTFRQNAFIPHVRAQDAEDPMIEPVVIRSDPPGEARAAVLLLVEVSEWPEWAMDYGHVCDFAETYDDERREAARQRFSNARSAGYQMRFVKAGEG